MRYVPSALMFVKVKGSGGPRAWPLKPLRQERGLVVHGAHHDVTRLLIIGRIQAFLSRCGSSGCGALSRLYRR